MADGIAIRLGFTDYTAADERLLAQVLAHPGSAIAGRKGLRPGAGGEVAVGGSPETWTVQPFSAVLHDAAGGGTYLVVVPNPVTRAMPTRPAAGSSRIHEVVVRVLNVDERSTDAAREVQVYLAEGAPAASPAAPNVPSNHLRLRRLTVPSSGTVAVVDVAQRTVAAGGVLPVRSEAERDAIASPWVGLVVSREDLDGRLQIRKADGWVDVIDGDVETAPTDTGWTNITLATGYSAAEAGGVVQTPQVRILEGVVYFRGGVTKTGGWASGASGNVAAAGAIPEAARPTRHTNDTISPLAANSSANGGFGRVGVDGALFLGNGDGARTTMYLAGLSGYTV